MTVTREDYDADLSYFQIMSAWLKNGLFQDRVRNIVPYIDLPECHVLDAGCGVGTFSIECAKAGSSVVALDYSQTALRFCAANAWRHEVGERITIVQASVEDMPFEDNTFDLVIAADIIEHIYTPARFWSEVCRVLKPGGRVVVETPNAEFMAFPGHGLLFKNVIERIWPLPESVKRTEDTLPHFVEDYHVNLYTTSTIVDEIEEAGLRLRHLDTRGWWLELRGYDRIFASIMDLPIIRKLAVRYKNTDIVALAEKPQC